MTSDGAPRRPAAESGALRLVLNRSTPPEVGAPVLDDDQSLVASHRRGPMLVLAGPGTGKTTTLVESVVARLVDPVDPLRADQVLVLTFGRRAAGELRARVTTRIGGGVMPTIATFHSFAYALMRQLGPADEFLSPPRLLSGPEQQARVRDLMAGSVSDGRSAWTADLQEAVRTRGFADEVRALIARVRGLGLEGVDLERLGEHLGDAAWQSVGAFAEEYLQVSDAEGVLDYTEMMLRSVLLAERTPSLRGRYRAVFVDEYQDTDPLQVRLLQALVTTETTLVVVGDPDQAIYSFRGADVRGLLRFREQFATPDGTPAPIAVLSTTRRFGTAIRDAATRVIGTASVGALPSAQVRQLRSPACISEGGEVEIVLCDDDRVQSAHIADLLRRAALDPANPIAWSDMAVLVRSGSASIPALRRALVAAGVPVEVAGDEIPLARESAVAPLLLAASVVAEPSRLTPEAAEALITSPLAGVDPSDLRRVVRALRRIERDTLAVEALALGEVPLRPRGSGDFTVEMLVDPSVLEALPEGPLTDAARAIRRLAQLLAAAREVTDLGQTPADVIWLLWSGTPWPRRLERAALSAGPSSRRAHSDLDAVVALLDEADRFIGRHDRFVGLANFIDELQSQEIPASALRESALRVDAVRLLTAHRSKGLEWRLVVVAGVQEESWPDIRRRGSLLGAETLGASAAGRPELVDPPSLASLLAEERRLFYVACTRARERLVVTAVRSPDDEAGQQPSRFLSDLAGDSVPQIEVGRAARGSVLGRPLTLEAVVAELRACLLEPSSPVGLRMAAADRLALVADLRRPDGSALVRSADPSTWWGLLDVTDPGIALRDPLAPVPLSGSSVSSITQCALQWFLEREAQAQLPSSTAIGFGKLVHAVADLVAREQVPADIEVLDGLLDRVWSQLGFEAPWFSAVERVEAHQVLVRFLHWHASRDRVLVGSELSFVTPLVVRGAHGDHEVVLRGSMDIVEIEVGDHALRVHVADLKTGGSIAAKDLPEHPQLGVYQAAVAHGAVAEAIATLGLPDLPVESGGSSLVVLRADAPRGAAGPKVLEQAAITFGSDDPAWIELPLAAAADVIRSERFWASPGSHCDLCAFRWQCPSQASGGPVVDL